MISIDYEKLEDIQKALIESAKLVMENAYNPYSNFFVGAALLTLDGRNIIAGANVENGAYGSTICAERAAIVSANAIGKRMFSKLAIIARGRDFDTTEVTGPCGACRQMLYESSQVSETNFEVIMSTTRKDKIIIATIEELLPLGFGPKQLGVDITRFQK